MKSHWEVDRAKVLSLAEVEVCLQQTRRRARRSMITRRSLIIFELATCCGLRVSEICGLRIGDIRLGLNPLIRIPATLGKGKKARTVPLTWDAGTLADLTDWIARRFAAGAGEADLLLPTRSGLAMHRASARAMFARIVRLCTGRKATIHDGRHTFVSLALSAGANIQAVRAAAGHASLATTSLYAHLIERGETVQLLGRA